jgi:hypothetical protein
VVDLLIVAVVCAVPALYAADRIIKARAQARRVRTMSERLAAATTRADQQQERRQEAAKFSAALASVMPAIKRPADQFSGTFILSYRGTPVLARAYGFADKQAQVPCRLNTIFALASMTKMFTATAVVQLIQQGRIEPYQTVSTYLDGFPVQAGLEPRATSCSAAEWRTSSPTASSRAMARHAGAAAPGSTSPSNAAADSRISSPTAPSQAMAESASAAARGLCSASRSAASMRSSSLYIAGPAAPPRSISCSPTPAVWVTSWRVPSTCSNLPRGPARPVHGISNYLSTTCHINMSS